MPNPFLDRQREGAVVVLTMNRPGTLNAVSDADAIDALVGACADINSDQGVRAVVLTGSGAAFSSGGNLKTMRETVGVGLGAPWLSRLAYRNGIQRVPLAWGLVSQVVPAERLLPTALALAHEIARHPGHALRMAKRLLREAQHGRLDTVLELSAAMQALAHHTPEHEQALASFAARASRPAAPAPPDSRA